MPISSSTVVRLATYQGLLQPQTCPSSLALLVALGALWYTWLQHVPHAAPVCPVRANGDQSQRALTLAGFKECMARENHRSVLGAAALFRAMSSPFPAASCSLIAVKSEPTAQGCGCARLASPSVARASASAGHAQAGRESTPAGMVCTCRMHLSPCHDVGPFLRVQPAVESC